MASGSISHDDVRNIAALARIAVPPERLDAIANELTGVLRHMDALAEVTEHAVANAASPNAAVRGDDGTPVALTRPLSAIAPESRDGFFLVPRLATHGDAGATHEGGA